MIDYFSIFNTNLAAFPNTLAINVTAPSAGDGTELLAAGVNDSWGFHQAMMDYGLNGVSPDTVTEAPGTSQMVEAMRLAFGHPGEVVPWHGVSDPASLTPPPRLLLLQGQGVLRATYPLLDAACYVGDPNNPTFPYYYHADDAGGAVRNTAGVWLILPEMRGAFVRGDDAGDLRDPDGSTRNFPGGQGSAGQQNDALKEHTHDLSTDAANFANAIGYTAPAGGGTPLFTGGVEGAASLKVQTTEGGKVDTVETRAINLQVKWCVRF